MALLSALAKERGLTILVTIHQPRREIFLDSIDVVMLLDATTVFLGPPAQVLSVFKKQLAEQKREREEDEQRERDRRRDRRFFSVASGEAHLRNANGGGAGLGDKAATLVFQEQLTALGQSESQRR